MARPSKPLARGFARPPDARIIDGRGKLVMPGLINAHTHSSETLLRGRYERMPLEIWLLYAYPLLMNDPIGERLLYLRSLLLAMGIAAHGRNHLLRRFLRSAEARSRPAVDGFSRL
jgi:5-methylthioadenosine/S-adenosylhomocysteine deaminase